MNMVFAEFIIAAFGLPIDFMASFYHGWKMGETLCHVTGFILTTTGMYKKIRGLGRLFFSKKKSYFQVKSLLSL